VHCHNDRLTLGWPLQQDQHELQSTPNARISGHFVEEFSHTDSIMSCSFITATLEISHSFPYEFYEAICCEDLFFHSISELVSHFLHYSIT